MDLDHSLERQQLALALQEKAGNAEERRAYRQFARDYFVQIRMTRNERGAPSLICGFPK